MEPLKITQICQICYNSYEKEEFLHLLCSHSFCKTCLFSNWQTKIVSGFLDITSFKCPQEGCAKPITLEFLYETLPKAQYSQLENLCNINSEVLTKDEKAVRCPKCDIRFNIWIQADYFKCPTCKTYFCSQCFEEWEKHKGISCKEYSKNKDLTPEQQAFLNDMKEKGFKQCPTCFAFVEKIGGCNYIKCLSPQCFKKNCFCFLCGEKIDKEKHYSHYYPQSPWEGPCVNQAKEKEKKVDFIKDEEKIVECPGCGVIDGKICNVENGLVDERFCSCVSEKCKGVMYCLLCKKKVSNENYDQHSKGDCPNPGICHVF